MGKVLRSIFALTAGLIVGAILVTCSEAINAQRYPPLPGMKLTDPAALPSYIKRLPNTAFVITLIGWAVGPFGGAWTAARLAGFAKLRHGMTVGVLFFLATLNNLMTLPYPIWVWIPGVGLVLPAAYLGARLATGKPQKGLSV